MGGKKLGMNYTSSQLWTFTRTSVGSREVEYRGYVAESQHEPPRKRDMVRHGPPSNSTGPVRHDAALTRPRTSFREFIPFPYPHTYTFSDRSTSYIASQSGPDILQGSYHPDLEAFALIQRLVPPGP